MSRHQQNDTIPMIIMASVMDFPPILFINKIPDRVIERAPAEAMIGHGL
jgi:hypothetical protein